MLLVLPACAIPHLRPAQPGPALPAGFPAGFPGATSPENSAQLGIKEFFNDPILTHLIDQALASNRELKILNEEVQIARNEILARQGTYLPFVTTGVSAGLNRYSRFTIPGAGIQNDPYLPGKFFPNPLPDYLLGLNLFWQVDIWRELRNARDAAGQRYLAASERRNYFVTRLVAEIAENYYGLMARDKRLENLDQIIKFQRQSLQFAEARVKFPREKGLGTFPVRRFEAEIRKNQSQILITKQEIIQTENRINFLVNRFPQSVERQSAQFYDLTFPLRVGVPAQLLQYRPDIRQAERELEAAGLDVKVARAHFFPKLAITGGVGYEAFNPKYLFWTPTALIGGAAGNLVAPLINFKAIQAEYLSANAKQLQSVYNYQRVILNAFTEVFNRVSRVENYSKSIALKQQQVEKLQEAVFVVNKLYQSARVEYLDVLIAQRDLWDARFELIETRQEQLFAIVKTYQALGGGVFLSNRPQGSTHTPLPGNQTKEAEEELPMPKVLPMPNALPIPNAPPIETKVVPGIARTPAATTARLP
jgi:NodT family efflux transporter outer membrane factor (OMF) lipoprotein